mgnify:CR=1 FL=1
MERFGHPSSPCILLLHGAGLGPWSLRPIAQALSSEFQVLLPALPGHAPDPGSFTSIPSAAETLRNAVRTQGVEQVKVLGGLSLGGQIALEILAQEPGFAQAALIESALVQLLTVPLWLLEALLKLTYPLVKQNWFARLQFKSMGLPEAMFADYFRDSQALGLQSLVQLSKANARFTLSPELKAFNGPSLVVAGSRELGSMRRSAELIASQLPNAELQILQGYAHGVFSLQHPQEAAAALRALAKRAESGKV